MHREDLDWVDEDVCRGERVEYVPQGLCLRKEE